MRTITLTLILIIARPTLADEPKVQRGIPCAEPKNERQMLDVYAPARGKNMPVVVWIHGGGLASGRQVKRAEKAAGIPARMRTAPEMFAFLSAVPKK